MTDFATTTAFQLVRRLAAAGQETPSLYMLISEPVAIDIIREDLAAEVEVQLGGNLRSVAPNWSEDAMITVGGSPVVLITLDQWAPTTIAAMDRNIVRLTTAGPVLLLATAEVAEKAVAAAPNVRSRLTDILLIERDKAFGGARREP
jgi:hypothetical protein